MQIAIIVAVAIAAGVLLGWLLARMGNRDELIPELRTQVASAQQHNEALQGELTIAREGKAAAEARANEQRAVLEEARARLETTFRALAAEALQNNNAGFLALAEQKFQSLKDSAAGELEARKGAIEQLLKPLGDTLQQYQSESRNLMEKRATEISAVGEQLRNLAETQNLLQQETSKLVTALRAPQVRGNWGEIALRRIAELAGMTKHCDFEEQVTVHDDDGRRLRPDMTVHLPADRDVVVDSKVPLEAYLDAIAATDDAARGVALDRHVNQIHQHVKALSSKQYWEQFPKAPEFVVMFIRNDSFLAAAAERDALLTETALSKGVVIATPTTLFALLKAIAFGWRQEEIAASAKKVSDLGVTLCQRTETLIEYMSKIGGALSKAVDSYNDAVASLDKRYLPAVNKFQAAVQGESETYVGPQLDLLDRKPRAIAAASGDE
jgi:DNA recombination protein RmuC